MKALPEGIWILIDGERVLPQNPEFTHVLVASKSVEGEVHSIEWDTERFEWTCTCMSFECRHTCRHIKAISRAHGGTAEIKIAVDDWKEPE